jgi:hypothetical protein
VWARVLAYITNRAIMERLDEVVGSGNWRNEEPRIIHFPNDKGETVTGVLCGLSLKLDGEWVTKWDGAEPTDIEPVKGGLSGSMKRAGVLWGIGRYLYDLPEGWAKIVEKGTKGAHYAQAKSARRTGRRWISTGSRPSCPGGHSRRNGRRKSDQRAVPSSDSGGQVGTAAAGDGHAEAAGARSWRPSCRPSPRTCRRGCGTSKLSGASTPEISCRTQTKGVGSLVS